MADRDMLTGCDGTGERIGMGEIPIIELLKSDPDVGPDLTNVNGEFRMAPDEIPQHWTLPAISYEGRAIVRQPQLDGVCSLAKRPVELTIWHYDKNELYALATRVRIALNNKYGTIAGMSVHRICIDPDEGEDDETVLIGGNDRGSDYIAYGCAVVYDVWYQEDVA